MTEDKNMNNLLSLTGIDYAAKGLSVADQQTVQWAFDEIKRLREEADGKYAEGFADGAASMERPEPMLVGEPEELSCCMDCSDSDKCRAEDHCKVYDRKMADMQHLDSHLALKAAFG